MSSRTQDLDPVRVYLNAPRCALLASVDPDGAPHQVVVHYVVDDDTVILNGRSDRRWVANLRRDPRVCLVVHDASDPLHWVGIKGRAGVSREGHAAVEDAMRIATRYGEDPTDYQEQERVSVCVVPDSVYEYR